MLGYSINWVFVLKIADKKVHWLHFRPIAVTSSSRSLFAAHKKLHFSVSDVFPLMQDWKKWHPLSERNIYIYIYIYIRMYTYTYVYIYICMYIYVYREKLQFSVSDVFPLQGWKKWHPTVCTQRNLFEMLLNRIKIILYLPFSDWFGTKRMPVCF